MSAFAACSIISAAQRGNPPVADPNDVMREQLDYLIAHVDESGLCDCAECGRYLRVRLILLAIFEEAKREVS